MDIDDAVSTFHAVIVNVLAGVYVEQIPGCENAGSRGHPKLCMTGPDDLPKEPYQFCSMPVLRWLLSGRLPRSLCTPGCLDYTEPRERVSE